MFDKLGSALKQPFYVWLLGIYPILHLYSENLGLVKDREVITAFAGMLAATSLAYLVSNRIIRSPYKTAFMLSACSLVFSLSGHVYVLVFIPRSLFVWTLLALIALAILLLILWRRASSQALERITPALNLILLALLVIPCTKIVSSYLSKSINVQPVLAYEDSTSAQEAVAKIYDSQSHPDVYYIIPDGYPSDSWLQKIMNYDNSAFTKALEDRGFVLVDHAQSNYGATLLSLASILNMQYFGSNPSPYTDLDFLRLSVSDNQVARQFQHFGYTYVQLLSGFWMPNPNADIIRDFTPGGAIEVKVSQNDFSTIILESPPKKRKTIPNLENYYKQPFMSMYLETTLLRIVSTRLDELFFKDDSEPYSLFAPKRFLATIDEVESIVRIPEATFTIIHLLKPHIPVVFDEHGEFLAAIWKPSDREIIAQYKFVNYKFLEMIDTILEESRNPPVIVFQADHGAFRVDTDKDLLRSIEFSPYAAYYLPDAYTPISFPKPYTIINTFPLIFNTLFESERELLDDRLIELSIGYEDVFAQRDVTAKYLGK